MKYFKQIYLLYFYGFFANFRPSDPFFYEFLLTTKNLPRHQVLHDVLPAFNYSTAIHLLFVFLLSDICGYKFLVVISSAANLVGTCLQIWTGSILEMEILQVLKGTSAATEVAYFIFIYGYYDVTDYHRTTAYTRSISLLGKAASAALGQLCINQEWLNYTELHYISLAAILFATGLSLFLPNLNANILPFSTPQAKISSRIKETCSLFKENFMGSFNQKYIKKFCVWCIILICSNVQATIFLQPLWADLNVSYSNGWVEAVLGISALLAVLLAGFLKIDWTVRTTGINVMVSNMIVFIGLMEVYYLIFVHYTFYILYSVYYYFLLTSIFPDIAKIVHKKCFGLVFGFIFLLAAFINAIVVCILNDDVVTTISEPQEYYTWIVLVHLVPSAIFMIVSKIKEKDKEDE